MRTIIILTILAIVMNYVHGGDFTCSAGLVKCGTTNLKILASETCKDKAPFFLCLRENGCTREDGVYKGQVSFYKYETCGATAIFMGWTLPILMLTVAKYFK